MKPSKDISRLIEIMAALREPVTGCPWDQQQNFATIAPYTIEEAYEVADAISLNDLPHLKEELGDLLFQVIYHSRMAEEQGAFDFGDVVEEVTTKMIRRHPHVFGTAAERAAGVTEGFWERAKDKEKTGSKRGVLDGVPVGLPALTRAIKLQNKAAKVGFDWPSLAPVFEKLEEEIGELRAEMDKAGTKHAADDPAIAEEFGDLLFVVANVARHLKIDPEAALRAANDKFTRRFRHIEEQLGARGTSPEQSNLAEMDALWDDAKMREKR